MRRIIHSTAGTGVIFKDKKKLNLRTCKTTKKKTGNADGRVF